ncbi:MFS transporter [Mycetocola zhadangensis]|uniref:MFS transporter n=1 Tax=Mycetocola zhadangensis TaxID=1164595 RepID=A0A3L7J4P7_9MICO|nr:MFS transporter [Mycetocola zhadangensis]RLQ85573.1 MFS transporter [Mycetocola zhadangensis]GGE83809.1 MFS transporter [Mycetocola zhadangensis]
MSAYSSLLRTTGVARIIVAQLVARFPFGMLSLAFLLHVEQVTGSYAAAGLVLAASSVGQALAGPLTSRWMGVWGMRPVLILTVIVCAISVTTVAQVEMSVPWYMGFSFLAGLSTPPIQPAVRTIYPKMVNSKQLTPLFSLDASAQEIIWVLGPVITTFISTQVGTQWGILTAVVIMAIGGTWFIASPEVGRVRIPRSKRKIGQVLKRPPVLLATVVGFLLIGACSALEVGVVATFGHSGLEAGIVLGILSLGSLAGGLALGHIGIGPWALSRRMFIVFAGTTVACFFDGAVSLSIVLFVAGIGIAPALTVLFAMVSSSVKFSDTAEAYGWMGTGQLIGAALGSAVAGVLIDSNGAIGAFWAASALAFVGFLVPLLGKRWHPDLRGRDASPIPDTEPIQVLTS